jgi:hypothetical protein
MSLINADLQSLVEPGIFQVSVGGGQPLENLRETTSSVRTAQFEVLGEPQLVEE